MASYDHYVNDSLWLSTYNAYQNKYANQIPERDKVLLKLIARSTNGKPVKLLDIGCSTGNLLLHAKRFFRNMELTGADLAESSLAAARANPELEGVTFERMGMLNIPHAAEFDIIVANAVAVYFGYDEYEKALRSVARALKPGGTYIAFEWLHPFEHQDITIIEKTIGHPEGLKIHFRPYGRVGTIAQMAGFQEVKFEPFEIPIDLDFKGTAGEVFTYTRKTESGDRLQFRGALFQPWCHLVATKSAS